VLLAVAVTSMPIVAGWAGHGWAGIALAAAACAAAAVAAVRTQDK
jgi:hypothetical protein